MGILRLGVVLLVAAAAASSASARHDARDGPAQPHLRGDAPLTLPMEQAGARSTQQSEGGAAPRAGPGAPDAFAVAVALGSTGDEFTIEAVAELLMRAFPTETAADVAAALTAGFCGNQSTAVVENTLVKSMKFPQEAASAAVAALGPESTPTSEAIIGADTFGYRMAAEARTLKHVFTDLTAEEMADALAPAYCSKNFTGPALMEALVFAGYATSDAYAQSSRYFDQKTSNFVVMAKILSELYPARQAAPALARNFPSKSITQLAQALGYAYCGTLTTAELVRALDDSGFSHTEVATVCNGGMF